MTEKQSLKKSLGVMGVVALGLGYMTPTVVFDTFGIVAQISENVVPLTYVAALFVMIFTAISYGKMVRVFPDAGSAYTYTRKTMGEHLGFFVGWASLLDYLLLPMVNALIIRIYLSSLFPAVPVWIWVVVYVSAVTAINVYSMKSTSNLNLFFVVFSIVLIIVFVIMACIQLSQGMGEGTIFTFEPLWHANVDIISVFSAATVVAFSFIGFDAVTMYTEEAKDANTVPRAIVLTVLIGGFIFFVTAYFAQALFPDIGVFSLVDDTLPEIGLYVGGQLFQLLLIAGAFAATSASGLASHASVSRLLYVMGRNEILSKKYFGYIHPKFRTPVFTVILTGIVSLAAIGPDLEIIASVINFGALIAFTFVNIAVIIYFVVKQKRYKTPKDVFSYIIMPFLGAASTGILWYHLAAEAFIGGLIWLTIGFIYILFLTKGFKKRLGAMGFEEADKEDDYKVN